FERHLSSSGFAVLGLLHLSLHGVEVLVPLTHGVIWVRSHGRRITRHAGLAIRTPVALADLTPRALDARLQTEASRNRVATHVDDYIAERIHLLLDVVLGAAPNPLPRLQTRA